MGAFLPKGFEWIIILIVVLLIFGPKNLPKLGSALGRSIKNLRAGIGKGKKKEEGAVVEAEAAEAVEAVASAESAEAAAEPAESAAEEAACEPSVEEPDVTVEEPASPKTIKRVVRKKVQ